MNSSRRRLRALEIAAITVLALVLVLGVGGYLVGYFLAGDRLPRNAVVAGVPVGGLPTAEAEQKLRTELGALASRPIKVSVEGEVNEVDPAEAGLALDVPASVAQAGAGRSFDPRHIWRVLTGGTQTDAVTTVDRAQLSRAVAALAAEVDRPAKSASLRYRDAELLQTPGENGITLDQSETADRLRSGYLNVSAPVEAVAAVTKPEITTEEATKIATDFARPAISGPIALRARGSEEFEVTPKMIAPALSFESKDGTLVPRLDPEKLHSEAKPVFDDADLQSPKDAKIVIRDGKPAVIPGTNGVTIGAAALGSAVEPVLFKTGKARQAEVEATPTEPDFTAADADKLGVKEITGEFTTRFPYAEYRNHNIGRAGELINNTLLLPGKTFSLNKTLGERTAKNGYVKGYIIRDGRFRMELGGGVSQSATTTFNAAFFAGLQDVEHRPHGLYINRYPAGREATVFWPTVDLRFKNNTDHGVLVQATVVKSTPKTQGQITVRMWSTKTYQKVASSALRRSNFTSGPVIRDGQSDCEPQASVQGFDVNYERLFYTGNKVVKDEKFFWRYKPTSQVVCI